MKDPGIAALKKELKSLKGRIEILETHRAAVEASTAAKLELLSSRHAMREAMLQFTQEVAAREGIPVDLFVSRFEAAITWHRDRFLQMIEGVDPQIAAQIDNRKITDIPTEELPPCIFPE
jgi:hypothetical protein